LRRTGAAGWFLRLGFVFANGRIRLRLFRTIWHHSLLKCRHFRANTGLISEPLAVKSDHYQHWRQFRMFEETRQASELARDPASVSWAQYVIIFVIALWGGIVRVIQQAKLGGKSWKQIVAIFVAEAMTSCFAGFITFLICEAHRVNQFYSAALAGLAGYMGGRALSFLETVYRAKTGKGD